MKINLLTYVATHLQRELKIVRGGPIALIESALTIEERTLIYKYSEDGYESLNNRLRYSGGNNNSKFGNLLENTLKKLPDYKGLVYRGANLSVLQIAKYEHAAQKNLILVEPSFLSGSKSPMIGNMYGNCRFTIISKSGKSVEQFAKYGLYSGQNEKEVLFTPNCKFDILEVTKENGYTLILMEEHDS